MKWFKHISDSLNDPDVSEIIEKFGGDGYLVFFGTLELMSKEFDIENPAVSTFSWKFLKKNLQLSRKKIISILSFFNEKPKNKRRLFCDIADSGVTIKCPKLGDLCDEWTKKELRKLRSKSKVTQNSIQHKDEDIETNIDTTPIAPPSRIDRFSKNEREIEKDAKKVLDMVNEELNKNFPDRGGHYELIKKRLREKYVFEQFRKVIQKKKKDSYFIANPNLLRPSTLFGDHFEEYLVEDENAYGGMKKQMINHRNESENWPVDCEA